MPRRKHRKKRSSGGNFTGLDPALQHPQKTRCKPNGRKFQGLWTSYVITDEPLHLAGEPSFSTADQAKYGQAFSLLDSGEGRDAISLFETLLQRYPSCGRIYNNLAVCYEQIGEIERVTELIVLNYQRNPDYLFGCVDYAWYCVRRGKLDEVSKIFDNTYDLGLLYPHRKVFHSREVFAFNFFLGHYFMRLGKKDTALAFFDIARQVTPCFRLPFRLRLSLLLTRILMFLSGKNYWGAKPTQVLMEMSRKES